MKKTINSLLLASLFLLAGCGSEDEDKKILRQTYIDISDFTMYRGSPEGGVEVILNNLKKKDLARKYLSRVYNPTENEIVSMQFNRDKLTYLESGKSGGGKQIISDYKISTDSLYIKIVNNTNDSIYYKFIALIDSDYNFYRRKGLVSYPNPNFNPEVTEPEEEGEQQEDRIIQGSLLSEVDLDTVLNLAGYRSLDELKNPADTIIWCNIIYPFN